MRDYLQPLVDEDDGWCATRASVQIGLAYARGHGAKKNRFAAIEWVGPASTLQPNVEGVDDIHGEVMNSHSLVKTIGTVFGAFLGRGGVTAEDLPLKPAE